MNRFFLFCLICFIPISFWSCAKRPLNELSSRQSPSWAKDAIIYEVSLRAFSKEGTLLALKTKLPELKKMGVTIISLLPFHPIGELNRSGGFGNPFAVKEFYNINSSFGSVEDLKELVQTAHDLGLKVILNIPVGVMAWDSSLLMEHPDWFKQNDEGAIIAPNDEWSDVAQMDLNRHEPRKYMIAMLQHWIQATDVDGFVCSRSDYAPMDFWEIAHSVLDETKSVIMIAQGANPNNLLKAFDVARGKRNVSNLFSFFEGSITANAIQTQLLSETQEYPRGSLLARYSWHSDDPRSIRRFTSQEQMVNLVFKMTIPGVPVIFNGEETGVDQRLDLMGTSTIDWTKNPEMQDFITSFCRIRHMHTALQSGNFLPLSNSDSTSVMSFVRLHDTDTILVVINPTKETKNVTVQVQGLSDLLWHDLFSNIEVNCKDSKFSCSLPPYQYICLTPKGRQ